MEFPDEILEQLLSEPFFTRRMEMLSRQGVFMLYDKLGVDFLTTSELLYPNVKIRLQLIRITPTFYMLSDNPNVFLGIVDCLFYTRRIVFKDDHHQERLDMLAYTPLAFNYMDILAKIFIFPAKQNQFIQENVFNNAPVCRVAIAMNTNRAFTGSYTENSY